MQYPAPPNQEPPLNITITHIETNDYLEPAEEAGRAVRIHARFDSPVRLPNRDDSGFHSEVTRVDIEVQAAWNVTSGVVADLIESSAYVALRGFPLTAQGTRDKRANSPTRVTAFPSRTFDPEAFEAEVCAAVARAYREFLASRALGVRV